MEIVQRTSENLFHDSRNSCIMRDFIFNKEKYTKSGKILKKNSINNIPKYSELDDNERISLPESRDKSLDDSNYDLNSLAVEMDEADMVYEQYEEQHSVKQEMNFLINNTHICR